MSKKQYTEYVSEAEIYAAYHDCMSNKRSTKSYAEFLPRFSEELSSLRYELNTMTYEIGRSTAFCVTKPKLREVFAANIRDRIVHHLLMLRLNPLIDKSLIDDTCNCRKGKGTQYAIDRLRQKMSIMEAKCKDKKYLYVLTCDLKSFFMSIDRDILYAKLETFLKEKYKGNDIDWVLWLSKKIIMHHPEMNCKMNGDITLFNKLPDDKTLFKSSGKGLPIGNLTSQIFGNFYLSEMDHMITEGYDVEYVRFVDDFKAIGEKRELKRLLKDVDTFMKTNYNIRLNKRKVYMQHYTKCTSFVGFNINRDRLYTGNRTVGNTINRIAYFNSRKKIWMKNVRKLLMSLNSYLGFMTETKSYNIRRMLINMIDDRYKAYFDIKDDYRKISLKKEYRKKKLMRKKKSVV